MKRHSSLVEVLILTALIGTVILPRLADAAGISGRLINKTPNGKGVDGVEVTLTLYRNDQEAGKTQGTTDRSGRFQFQDLSAKPGETYGVMVRYQGAEYNTDRIILESAAAPRKLEIPVYDSTTDASKISVKLHHVLFGLEDGIPHAEELLVIQNTGNAAYIGSKEVSGGRRATLRFTLPPGVREVKYGEGLMACCIVPEEQGFVDTMDVKPGERKVMFSYTLAPEAGRFGFTRPVDYPTEAVEVFVPEGGLQISSETLKPAGVVSWDSRRFRRYTGASLEAPGAITLGLSNLPALGGGWRRYAYASVGILLAVGVAYPLVRRRHSGLSAAGSGPACVAEPRTEAAREASPTTPTQLSLRKVELVAALAELESRHEAGRIMEKEYRRLRHEKRKALRDVLAQLDEGITTAATTPGA